MRISDWSSDVCSSDLFRRDGATVRLKSGHSAQAEILSSPATSWLRPAPADYTGPIFPLRSSCELTATPPLRFHWQSGESRNRDRAAYLSAKPCAKGRRTAQRSGCQSTARNGQDLLHRGLPTLPQARPPLPTPRPPTHKSILV